MKLGIAQGFKNIFSFQLRATQAQVQFHQGLNFIKGESTN